MDRDQQDLSHNDDIDAYLDALPRQRITRGKIGSRTVWIKRYDAVRRPFGKLLHETISPLLPHAVQKASPRVDPHGLADREFRKISAFDAAGFHVPEVLFRRDAILVLSDEGQTLEGLLDDLRTSDVARHDRLLIESAVLLAKAHAAGLCHGRPHKRDILLNQGVWGFIDFEEEPEAVMPLAAAQARDVWLLFFQITHAALNPETAKLAFAAYRQGAPGQVLDSLNKLVGPFRRAMPLVRLFLKLRPGGDIERLRKVTDLLSGELARAAADTTGSQDASSSADRFDQSAGPTK